MTFNTAKWLDLDEFMIFVARHIQNASSAGSRQSNGVQPRSHSHSQPITSVPIIKCEPTPDSLQDLLDCAVPDDHVSACRQKRKIPSLVSSSGTSSAQSTDAMIQSREVIEISDTEESNPLPRPLAHATQMKEGRKRKHAAVPDR
jgi:hypothetical protein